MNELLNNTDQFFIEAIKEYSSKYEYPHFYIDRRGCLRKTITYELVFETFSKITKMDIKLIKSERMLKNIAITYFNKMINKRNIIEEIKKFAPKKADTILK